MPRITNVQREGWRSGFYVGRRKDTPHHFGNPFEVSIYGRKQAVKMFEEWLEGTAHQDVEPERRKWILDNLEMLKGKDLMCFCAPALCHAEIYFKLLGQEIP